MKPTYFPFSPKEGCSLLEKSSFDTTSDDEVQDIYVPKVNNPSLSWLRLLAFHTAIFLLYALVTTWVVVAYVGNQEFLGPRLIYTPARNVLSYHRRPPIPSSTNKLHQDPYFGDPNPELDQRWVDLLRYATIRLSHEEFVHYNQSGILLGDGSGYLATPTMYHDMHCIKFLHQSIYPEHYWPDDTKQKRQGRNYHARHCLRNLAHSITCGADMSIRVMQWLPDQLLPAPVDTDHECHSWERINNWAKERYVNTGEEGMVVHPVLGAVFPGGDFKGDDE